ncbi:MAG: hydrogenase maturation nickel metallochaperone HypA [Candidatus Tritonobacter lacicola]|nr:hydrogenase maturation nickel metallochaperone HypA [Candidatus Tritonobacter lacicola]
MHELAIAENILRNVLKFRDENSITTVEAINIKIGVLQQVSSESLLFSLETLTKGTELEGARFNLEKVDAAIECNACGKKSILRDYLFRCPACGKSDVKVIAGRELFIDSIEIPDETDDGKDECPMLNVQ